MGIAHRTWNPLSSKTSLMDFSVRGMWWSQKSQYFPKALAMLGPMQIIFPLGLRAWNACSRVLSNAGLSGRCSKKFELNIRSRLSAGIFQGWLQSWRIICASSGA